MKAYIDSFAGLIPCKIVKAYRDQNGTLCIDVIVTAKRERAGYKRGELVESVGFRIVPRDAIRRSNYGYRILPYNWTDRITID